MRASFGCLAVALASCAKTPAPPDAGLPPARVTITATDLQTRTQTREHFLAAVEMQLSGEPLAEAMGRQLSGYSRDHVPADLYFDTSPLSGGPWVDLAGFSSAVESYEYSKQPMNSLAFESGAGTSLVFGPLLLPGADGGLGLADRLEQLAAASNALGRWVFEPGTYPTNNPGANINPFGSGTPDQNPLGWPGIWPTLHAFRSFEPANSATGNRLLWCSIASDDDVGGAGAAGCGDYECDATTLHLKDRAAQVERVITPGADGFSGWKYGLWVLNYLQVLHDSNGAAVARVPSADGGLLRVGAPGNDVLGSDPNGNATAPGTWLGSSDIEGFQAGLFLEQLDNRGEDWLRHLATADGLTLSGFGDLDQALRYHAQSPLRWFPKEISVSESSDPSGFPRPSYAIRSADSSLLDHLGLALSAATLFAITDPRNPHVGGAPAALAWFDGAPFGPAVRTRALALLRVELVNLDRLHVEPTSGLFVDEVVMTGTTPTRGATVSTVSVAYSLVMLRTALRALHGQLELYSNHTPDSAFGSGPLDDAPLHLPGDDSVTVSQRAHGLLLRQGALLMDHLTDATGRAWPGWNVVTGERVGDALTLESHAAAVRGLFTLYLATGDVRFRDRAAAVFGRLDVTFYDAEARIYGATPAPVDEVTFTPLRFALLQAALRETYVLIATRPGNEEFALELEGRIGRLNKLVLNGWDDRDGNRRVDWPRECARLDEEGRPRGGLQMAERTLTGELGSFGEAVIPFNRRKTFDRENDCVPEIDDEQLPASLADSITFHVSRAR